MAVLVHGHPGCAPSEWVIVLNNQSPFVFKETSEGHNRVLLEDTKKLYANMNSERGRGGMYETNITDLEGSIINLSRVIWGRALSFQIFPSIPPSPPPTPVILKL